MDHRTVWVLVLVLGMAPAGEAGAQQFAYPAKGQSAEQQKKDEAACHTWTVQQTGFGPAKARAACLEGRGYAVK